MSALCHGTYAPTRESDGDWYVGTMLDRRQALIDAARRYARKCLQDARKARLAGNSFAWEWCMRGVEGRRRQLAQLLAEVRS